MAEAGGFAWLLFFSIGWFMIAPFLASYEASAVPADTDSLTGVSVPDFATPDGSNPLTLIWDYLNWFKRVLTFETSPATSFLTYILFIPLTAIGIYLVIK